jgi:Flp pilus assembly protein protease CpaA
LALSVKNIRKIRIGNRLMAVVVIASSMAVVISIVAANQTMLAVTTPLLVLVTVAVSALVTGNAITRLLAWLRYSRGYNNGAADLGMIGGV